MKIQNLNGQEMLRLQNACVRFSTYDLNCCDIDEAMEDSCFNLQLSALQLNEVIDKLDKLDDDEKLEYIGELEEQLYSQLRKELEEFDNKIRIAKTVERTNVLSSIIEEDDMEVMNFIIARKVIKTIGENQCNDYNFLELDKEIIRVYQEELETTFKPDLENLSIIRAICLDYIYRGV